MSAGLNDGRHIVAEVRRALVRELLACAGVGVMLAGSVAFFWWTAAV